MFYFDLYILNLYLYLVIFFVHKLNMKVLFLWWGGPTIPVKRYEVLITPHDITSVVLSVTLIMKYILYFTIGEKTHIVTYY